MASATLRGVARGGGFGLTLFLALIATPGHLAVHLRGIDPEASTPQDAEGNPHDTPSQADQASISSAFLQDGPDGGYSEDTYEGPRDEMRRANGQGLLRFRRGGFYKGGFKDGKKHGYGELISRGGGSYKGNWEDDTENGRGTWRHGNGDVYVGTFKDGVRHGRGKLTEDNGVVYEGEFTNGEQTGKGKKTYINGDVYVGQMEGGKRTGCGTYTARKPIQSMGGIRVIKAKFERNRIVEQFSSMARCRM